MAKTKRKSTAAKIVDKGKKQIVSMVEIDNDNFKHSLNVVAGTKEGQYVLNRLMDNCGFLRSSVILCQDGTIDEGTVEYREGRRSVWVREICKYLSEVNMKKVLFLKRKKLCQTKKE